MVVQPRISKRQRQRILNPNGPQQRPDGKPDGRLLGNHHPTHHGAHIRAVLPLLSGHVLVHELDGDPHRPGQVCQVV